ncbi:hypothetical protein AJ79_05823, partial [Helicocarpus griseus UAMH5409]
MACHILKLQAELQYQIAGYLQSGGFEIDIRSLSLTCSFYYATLIPYTFKRLVLYNDETSAASIMHCLNDNSKWHYAEHVKELYFTNKYEELLEDALKRGLPQLGDKDYDSIEGLDQVCQLPTKAIQILANLTRYFPNLETLTVEWRLEYENNWWYEGYFFVENENDIPDLEAKHPWRALMRNVYNAIGQNTCCPSSCSSSQIPGEANSASNPPCPISPLKSLEIINLPANSVSSFFPSSDATNNFHRLLNHLDAFKISLMVEEYPGDHWLSNVDQFQYFCSRLDAYFFDHLHAATTVSVTSLCGALGTDGFEGSSNHSYCPFQLFPAHVPKLKQLELNNCCITGAVREFLVAHAKTLEKVELVDCWCDYRESWGQLFSELADAGADRLVEFTMQFPGELDFEEWEGEEGEEEEENGMSAEDIQRRVEE